MKQGRGQVIRLLRRSVALALVLAVGWITWRTADLTGAALALDALTGDSQLALALLRAQLPGGEQEAVALGPWQRLVLAQSPMLSTPLPVRVAAPEPEPEPDPVPAPQPPVPEEPAPEDREPEPPQIQLPDNVVAQTLKPSAGQTYLTAGDIYIANRAQKEVDTAVLASAPVNITLGEGPQILIVHTHGTEAYTTTGAEDTYVRTDPYRTLDCNYNVVRVGEEMTRVFQEHGFSVIHDTNLYDYPSYNEAYDRSKQAVEQWLRQYPSIQFILDVHRDALEGTDGTVYKVISQEEEGQVAQVMLVVGTDGTGKHPLWQENLTLAMRLQQQLLEDYNTLARPIVLRSSRFNQHLSVGFLLVEVGTHGNSLAEAVCAARLFAESACAVLDGLK